MGIHDLPPHLEEKARKELNEVPSKRAEDIEQIRSWLETQPHITARKDDLWLLNFLRACKFDFERTKAKLETFYSMRTITPEFYTNRDPMQPEIQAVLKQGIYLPILKEDQAVIVLQWKGVDPNKTPILDIFKVGIMILDIVTFESNTCTITGQDIVDDFTGASVGYASSLSLIKKMLLNVIKAYPARPKSIHMINAPMPFVTIFKLLTRVLTQKVLSRIQIYGKKYENIYDTIPRDYLPTEYGGTAGSADEIAAEWKAKIESYRDWLIEDEMYRVDETKRKALKSKSSGFFNWFA